MDLNLSRLLEELDTYDEKIPLECLNNLLLAFESYKDLIPFTQFSERHYQRNLIRRGPAYEALLICWESGQRSMIHDHIGSNCAVKIIKGLAHETTFTKAPNDMVIPSTTKILKPNKVYGAEHSDIHQISNLQPDNQLLVSLHVYSPKLENMNVFSLTNPKVRQWSEATVELMHGAGI